MIDIHKYAAIGAKFWQRREDPFLYFLNLFFNTRKQVSDEIARYNPKFSQIDNLIKESGSLVKNGQIDEIGQMLENEVNIMADLYYNNKNMKNNIDFAILFTAQAALMYGDNTDEETKDIMIKLMNDIDQIIDDEPFGFSAFLLATAFWFSDYKDFRNLVYQKECQLRQEGFFKKPFAWDPVEI